MPRSNSIVTSIALAQAEPHFRRAFLCESLDEAPFASHLAHRTLLWEVGMTLGTAEWSALSAIARSHGDRFLFLSLAPDRLCAGHDAGSWRLSADAYPFAELARDQRYEPMLTGAFYSPTGGWGLITSYEGHAVLGSSSPHLQLWQQHAGDPSNDQDKFVNYWRALEGAETAWVDRLREHVNAQGC